MVGQTDVQRQVAEADERVERVLGDRHRELLPADLVTEIEQARQTLAAAAAEPITIGFVGFFSTGKSVLIGALLGDPRLLPDGQVPVTGNVLAVHPRAVDDDRPTTPAPLATVEYFDGDAVARLREDFHQRLVTKAGLYSDPGPASAEWAVLADWCATTGSQFDLAGLIDEFERFYAAVKRYPQLIGPVPVTVQVPWEVVRASVMLLPDAPRVDVEQKRTYGGLTVAQLTGTAPLIERIHLDVEVPRRFWPVDQAVAGDEIVLLDFPGRGAGRSAARDEFLRARASETINTLLVLLDPTKPGEGSAAEILRTFVSFDWGEAGGTPDRGVHSRRNAVLAGISRFDLLPDTAPEPRGGLEVAALPDSLRTLWSTAREVLPTGVEDRAVIVSATTHWATADDPGPPPVPLGDQDADEFRAAQLTRARKWGAVAAALPPTTPITAALADYARDGGMGRLRHVVTAHARERGVPARAHRVKVLAAALDRHVGRAWEVIRDRQSQLPTGGPEQQRLRDAISATMEARTATELAAKRELQDPEFELPIGRTARTVVEQFVTEQVYSWPEWRTLLGAVENGEVIVRSGRTIPVSTTSFVEPFGRTAQGARLKAAEVARHVTTVWLTRRHRDLAPVAEELLAQLRPVKERLTAAPNADAQLGALLRVVGVRWLIDAQPDADLEPLGDRELDHRFPLRTDRALPWHPARRSTSSPADRHQIQVMRLRRELANALIRLGVDTLVEQLKRRLDLVVDELGLVAVALPADGELEKLLETAFPPPDLGAAGPAGPELVDPTIEDYEL